MIKQLKKVGNGQALFLDRALMDLVGLRPGSEVQVVVDGGSLIITPAHRSEMPQVDFEAALEDVVTEYREVLKRLAE